MSECTLTHVSTKSHSMSQRTKNYKDEMRTIDIKCRINEIERNEYKYIRNKKIKCVQNI